MSRADDRKAARREAMANERKKIDEGTGSGFKYKNDFLVSDEQLEDLGVGIYTVVTPEKGKGAAVGKIHLLPANEEDCKNNLDITAFPLYYHPGVGPDDANMLCPKHMKKYLQERGVDIPEEIADGKCPICEAHDIVKQEFFDEKETKRKEALQAQMKSLRAHSGKWDEQRPKAFLTFVVDAITEDSENDGPKIFLMPTSFHDKNLLDLTLDYDNANEDGVPGFIDLQNIEEPVIVLYRNDGDGYDRYNGFRVLEYKYELDEKWYDSLPCWMDCLKFHTYEELDAVFEGVDLDSIEDEPEERSRRPRESKEDAAPRRRRPEKTTETEVEPTPSDYADEPEPVDEPEPEPTGNEDVDNVGKRTSEGKPRRRRTNNE